MAACTDGTHVRTQQT